VEINQNFMVSNLCVPELVEPDDSKFNALLDLIRNKFLSKIVNSTKYERVYISRKKAKNGRKILNEDELISLLSNYDFRIIETEKMSLLRQVEIFYDTSFLVGAHGAGMIHSLFMKNKSTVIELFSPVYINYCCTKNSVELLSHKYHAVVSECTGKYSYGENQDAPIHIPIKVVKNILDVHK
ncbi:MAG: glycosyltransferase family 61 protein, partial [Candidatus Sericytochromatia bacterium]